MSDRQTEVSVVLPAYNEEDTIEHTVRTTRDALGAFLPAGSYEVVVAEDGCDDRTPDIADELAAAFDDVRHFHSDERLGRGGALDAAFAAAHGDVLVYFDTDMATDMRHLEHLVESVRSGDYDVATGSRWMSENVADRPAKRGIPSRGFNLAARLFLGSELRDHQCGFKSFSREAFERLEPDVEDEHWFWDTEMLVRAQRAGLRVHEFPVDWEPKGDSKVDLVRDVFGMGSQVVRCWWEFSVEPYVTRRTGALAGIVLTLVALGLMLFYLDPSSVLAAMADADPAIVALGAVVYALSWPLRGLRYRDILSELGYREDVWFLTGAVFVSQTGNLVFPMRGGDFIRAYVVKARRRVPYTSGFASLAVERVFDLLTITLLAGSVLLGLAAFAPEQVAAIAGAVSGDALGADQRSAETALAVAGLVGALAVAAVVAIVASARMDGGYARRLIEWASDDGYVELVAGVVESFVADVQTVAADGPAFARVGATSVLVWGIDVVTALCVLLAFGVDLPLSTLLATGFFAVSVGNLAKVLPLSPGGIGLYEGAFTLLVVALTPIGAPAALAVALVDHAVKNAVTVVGGVVSMLTLNVSLTEAVEGPGADAMETEAGTTD
ncbi:uncharacterized membrane protein YbhN (UPF0104 family) [Halarchaeum solikamskense]|uniref:flippase-like domain-containing protein n=1 Tax=Halarchaeum nitratireducens TaxID=489913 RepID=UPI001B3B003F|nr:flippase-like domain-containing protein [Halarchaeum solikamskense]MBP2251525.1 uncharacterized membrane protein YbhN (UPF0104 family) [Halarchaeum solikamskense]